MLSGAAIILSWLILQAGFTLLYMSLHADYGGFAFPGTQRPRPMEFADLAVSVGTTFGTTDVTITRAQVRRHVMVHSVLAFMFNTLILAVAVTVIIRYVTP